MAYTAVPTVTTGELWTAANQNTYLRDNMAAAINGSLSTDGGLNITDVSDIANYGTGVIMPDNKSCTGVSTFRAKDDSPTINAIIRPDATGNVYSRLTYIAGANGEQWDTHSDTISYAAISVTNDDIEIIQELTCTDASEGDVLHISWDRDATNASDTLSANVYHIGFYITY